MAGRNPRRQVDDPEIPAAGAPPHRSRQTWTTFLRNHAGAIWAGDLLPVTDFFFRQLYAFFVIELSHAG